MTLQEKCSFLEACTLLKNPPHEVVFEDGGQTLHVGVVEGEVTVTAADCHTKHALHKIRLTKEASTDGSEYAYRLGYWAFTKDKKNIKWGQFHSTLSEKEWATLLGRAREQGWKV
jgi:hypothetical protein